jgi:hypothetical protein
MERAVVLRDSSRPVVLTLIRAKDRDHDREPG